MVDMGGMILSDYAFYIGILGIICALAFIKGINQ